MWANAWNVFRRTPSRVGRGRRAAVSLFLEELMAGAARWTKRVAKSRAIPPAAWTEGRFKAWADAQDLVANAVTLYHPRPGCQVFVS